MVYVVPYKQVLLTQALARMCEGVVSSGLLWFARSWAFRDRVGGIHYIAGPSAPGKVVEVVGIVEVAGSGAVLQYVLMMRSLGRTFGHLVVYMGGEQERQHATLAMPFDDYLLDPFGVPYLQPLSNIGQHAAEAERPAHMDVCFRLVENLYSIGLYHWVSGCRNLPVSWPREILEEAGGIICAA